MIKIRMYIFKKQSKGMLPTQSSMTMNCNLKFQIKKEKKIQPQSIKFGEDYLQIPHVFYKCN